MIGIIRKFILFVAVVLSALLAYGVWTLPKPVPADAETFSSARVVEDIRVISANHHSVAHPVERAEVRDYLVKRLVELGADTVNVFRYDSLTGPQNRHVEYTFDAYDVLAEFAPVSENASDTYLMLVAHYDSRYSQPMPRDTVWSYGAADDGYGVGVILETVSQVLKNRSEWVQGVKVLFTDAEEVGMMGMKAIWENDRYVFDNVGLVINVEARGTWGPALLFEACPGNSKVQDLYASCASYPYTYSLTTVVYGFMPNFTDFTIVKDSLPGLNFSTIADVNHYHTDLDCFENISERSIQHYGEQILPIVATYLSGEEYSDRESLRADSDKTNFTIPVLGLFSFTKTGYMILNIVIFILFVLLLVFEALRGRIRMRKVCGNSLKVLGAAVVALVAGEGFAYACASAVGAKFNLFGIVQGIPFDNTAMLLFVALLFVACVLVYWNTRTKAARAVSGSMRASAVSNALSMNALNILYGVLVLQLVLSVALLAAVGENLMFFIPLALASAGLMLWRITSLKLWLVVAIAVILLHAFSFLFALSMALTIGALGAVALIALIDMMTLIPLADLYLSSSKRK